MKWDIVLGYPSIDPWLNKWYKQSTWYRYLRPHYCFIVNSYCLVLLPIATVFWSDCQDKDVIWPHQIFQDQKHFLEIVHGKLTAAIIKSLFRISCSQLLSTRHRAGALSVPVLLFVGYSRLIHAWFYVIIVVAKKCCTCCSWHIYPRFVYKLSVWLASLPLNDHVFWCDHVVMLNIKVPKPQHALLVLVMTVAKPTLKVTMLSSIVRLFLTLIYYMDIWC